MAEGDVDAALACFREEDAKNPAVIAAFDFLASSVAFHDRFDEVYCETAWEKFNGPDGFSMSLPVRTKAEDFTVTIEGDRAICYAPNETKPGILVRENGKWYVTPEALVPTGTPVENHTRLLASLAEMTREYAAKLDRSVDPARLDAEMGLRVMTLIGPN